MNNTKLKFRLFPLIIALFVTPILGAGPYGELVYADNEEEVIVVRDGEEEGAVIGMELTGGDVLVTGNSTAELSFEHIETAMHVDNETTVRIDELIESADNPEENRTGLDLINGRLRAIVDFITDNVVEVATDTGTAGVRGTDFGIQADDEGVIELGVITGMVEFTNRRTGASATLEDGEGIDVLDPFATEIEVVEWDDERLEDFFEPLGGMP